jgi:hypothetical protein
MNQTATPTSADITKLIDARLSGLPEVRAAIESANARTEALAASARKSVLDDLTETEAALADLEDVGREVDADIAALRQQLQTLNDRRVQHEMLTHQAGRRARDLSRQLHTEHGEAMIVTILNQLRSHERHQRAQADWQRRLTIKKQNIWGEEIRTEDPDALAKAAEIEGKAERIEAAIHDIHSLTRQPISPQEIQRRIAVAVEPVGFRLNVEDPGTVSGWRIEGWRKGKSKSAA